MGLFASMKRNSIGKDGGPPLDGDSADGFANEETTGIMKDQGLTRNVRVDRAAPLLLLGRGVAHPV